MSVSAQIAIPPAALSSSKALSPVKQAPEQHLPAGGDDMELDTNQMAYPTCSDSEMPPPQRPAFAEPQHPINDAPYFITLSDSLIDGQENTEYSYTLEFEVATTV